VSYEYLYLFVVVSSRCHTYIPIYEVLFPPTHSSQLTFSEQWFGPHAFTHEVVGSAPCSATFPFAVCDVSCVFLSGQGRADPLRYCREGTYYTTYYRWTNINRFNYHLPGEPYEQALVSQ